MSYIPCEERTHTSVAVFGINMEHLPGNELGDVYILQLALVHSVWPFCVTLGSPLGHGFVYFDPLLVLIRQVHFCKNNNVQLLASYSPYKPKEAKITFNNSRNFLLTLFTVWC